MLSLLTNEQIALLAYFYHISTSPHFLTEEQKLIPKTLQSPNKQEREGTAQLPKLFKIQNKLLFSCNIQHSKTITSNENLTCMEY